jgi:hypothetical protein
VNTFQKDGTNERMCKRLAIIRDAFRVGAFSTLVRPGIFEALAIAARLKVLIE